MSNDQRDLTDEQAAEFIRQQAIGLANQAKRARLPMLAYLLEMAIAEAYDVVRRVQVEKSDPDKKAKATALRDIGKCDPKRSGTARR